MIPETARCKNKVCSILFGLHNYLAYTYTPFSVLIFVIGLFS